MGVGVGVGNLVLIVAEQSQVGGNLEHGLFPQPIRSESYPVYLRVFLPGRPATSTHQELTTELPTVHPTTTQLSRCRTYFTALKMAGVSQLIEYRNFHGQRIG